MPDQNQAPPAEQQEKSTLVDRLEAQRRQRAADMQELLARTPGVQSYALYTYQQTDEGAHCHIYGPSSQAGCEAVAQSMQASAQQAGQPPLTVMVLPLESLPS